MKYLALIGTALLLTSCVSTKSTIKNIDNSAKRPSYANEMYLITEYAEDSNYAFDADYPINIGFIHDKQEEINVYYFFNGLEGPNGEKIQFQENRHMLPFFLQKTPRWEPEH